ncbi:uncharacterized protein LOC115028911 isoform X2 [Cottoperca gobio]|uniref:Uncharacterized protein LOC115028911 isoform X2 n=1 Tax=Cottoperca gobio TaxID=56716 RepID=A0A6J2S607_COTGO|nr:uncharacterized protein LOC115028911 isoform X2 [Cottoperca gobio]
MAEFRRIIMSSFLMLLLLFTASGDDSYIVVRVGDDVTLSSEDVIHDEKCYSTTWYISSSENTVKLFEHGEIHKEAGAKSDRLSVTEKCSLVIKKVTVQDVGYYTCRQFISRQQHGGADLYDLSVVTSTEHHDNDQVTLLCSVSTSDRCIHRVEWLYEGDENDVMMTSQSTCSAEVTFPTARSYCELLKCAVTDRYNKKEHLFTFSPPQSSGEKPGDDATTTTSPTTTSPTSPTSGGTKETASEDNNNPTEQVWWRSIIVCVGLAALIISVVTVNIWTRTKGNETQMRENLEQNDEDEDEDQVNYENVGDTSTSV